MGRPRGARRGRRPPPPTRSRPLPFWPQPCPPPYCLWQAATTTARRHGGARRRTVLRGQPAALWGATATARPRGVPPSTACIPHAARCARVFARAGTGEDAMRWPCAARRSCCTCALARPAGLGAVVGGGADRVRAAHPQLGDHVVEGPVEQRRGESRPAAHAAFAATDLHGSAANARSGGRHRLGARGFAACWRARGCI